MLQTLCKLYVMYMLSDTRSPLPHLVGPPGCGKSTTVDQLAKLVGVNLHVINVSRISPLEVEGVQMPVDGNTKLQLLHATQWTSLKEGDIVLFDEFLRGFPEVYNALLDIFTSRKVADLVLPKVFLIGASNSTTAYDKALEDRLLHIPVPDPRRGKVAKKNLAQMLVKEIGLLPDMVDSYEMQALLDNEVLPMFEILDHFKSNKTSSPAMLKGSSIRNLIGQAKLRHIQSSNLRELLDMNNTRAIAAGKYQYVVLSRAESVDSKYLAAIEKLPVDKLTAIQALNLECNKQLLSMQSAITTTEKEEEEDELFDPPF